MSRWWRAYDDAINHPKLLRLSDELFRAWFTLLCVASQNDGELPPAADIALTLRLKPSKVAEWITKLSAGGLLDKTETGFVPHNWHGRQYKSDVSTERVKRFRNKKRNVSSAVSETAPEQSRTEADTETEREQKPAREFSTIGEDFELTEADIAAAHDAGMTDATIDAERKLFIARKQSDGKQSANWSAEWVIWCERWKAMKKPNAEPEGPAKSVTVDHDAALRLFTKTGVWSKWAGPEPGQLGCLVPAETFAKYGLLPDGRKSHTETQH